MCSDDDLRELNLGFGPRKKLSSYIKQQKEEQELVRQRRVEARERERAQKEEEEKKKKAEEQEGIDGRVSKVFGAKIMYGLAGTGQTFVRYPTLLFTPRNLFAVGSPIGLFLTVRFVLFLSLALRTKIPLCAIRVGKVYVIGMCLTHSPLAVRAIANNKNACSYSHRICVYFVICLAASGH